MGSDSDSETEGRDLLRSIHSFSCGGRHYAVEGTSGSAFELDSHLARALAGIRDPGTVPQPPLDSRAASEAGAGLEELREKVRRSARGGARLRWREERERSPRAVELCLCASFRCNLACAYCFVRLGSQRRQKASADMTLETAKAAVEFALDQLTAASDQLIVSFGHTGEPLLSKALYAKLGEYVRRRAADTGRRIAYGMAATNLTLAGEGDVPNPAWLTVSLDGPREIHDQVRRTRAGDGTYDVVVSAFRRLLASLPTEAAGANLVATLTRRSTDIRGIFLHLVSLGAPFVTLSPARLPPTSDLAITEAAADELLAGYDDLLQHLLSLGGDSLAHHLGCMVHAQDYFGRHVLRIALGHRVTRRCDAGTGLFAVTPDGSLFPCPELAALGCMPIGSIHGGIRESVVSELRSRDVRKLAPCAACWARLWCGGECLSHRAMYQAFGSPPDPGMCRFTRGLIERAIHLVSWLRRTNSDALRTVLDSRAHQITGVKPLPGEPHSTQPARANTDCETRGTPA